MFPSFMVKVSVVCYHYQGKRRHHIVVKRNVCRVYHMHPKTAFLLKLKTRICPVSSVRFVKLLAFYCFLSCFFIPSLLFISYIGKFLNVSVLWGEYNMLTSKAFEKQCAIRLNFQAGFFFNFIFRKSMCSTFNMLLAW